MKRLEVILLGLFLFLSPSLFAQVVDEPENNSDGFYTKEAEVIENNKKAFDFPYVREADVVWAHRVWRVIDFREKINQVFYYPLGIVPENQGRMNLYNVLNQAIMEGRIRVFDDDMFTKEIVDYKAYLESFASKETIEKETGEYDLDGFPVMKDTTIVTGEVREDEVYSLRIKEDWFIDRARSVEDVRIIGFTLVAETVKGATPLGWVRYNDPEVRELLANSEVYNMDNDRARRSYDDIFRKRIFSSYIIRESNDFNRSLEDYVRGIDAMMESQRIEDYIFEMEEDMWEY